MVFRKGKVRERLKIELGILTNLFYNKESYKGPKNVA